MSRRAGNLNENAVSAMAEALGYCAFPARGSRGKVDIVCFDDENNFTSPHRFDSFHLPALAIQVGTHKKPIAATLAELQAAPRPIGSLCIVARRLKQKGRTRSWQFISPAGKFSTLADAVKGAAS